MTTTLIWTGVTLWLGLNAAILARSIYVALPAKNTGRSARIIHLQQRRA